jgi:hypothetical protein
MCFFPRRPQNPNNPTPTSHKAPGSGVNMSISTNPFPSEVLTPEINIEVPAKTLASRYDPPPAPAAP